jgi:hypothetical protein
MPGDIGPVALTSTQRLLISTLLAELAHSDAELAGQAAAAQALSNCNCGCPSIDIVTDHAARSRAPVGNVDLIARDATGLLYAVLSVRNGRLTELDCVSQGDRAHLPRDLTELSGWTFTAEPVA